MKAPLVRRAGWIGAAVLMALLGAPFLLIAALDAGHFKSLLIHFVEAHFNRQIRIEGALHVNLWSHHPSLIAEQVVLFNPAWVSAGEMGRAGRLTLTFDAPGVGRPVTLQSVILEDATLHLVRDEAGHANWRRVESPSARGKGLPLLKELLAQGAHLTLDDARRHLNFEGIVSAEGRPQTPMARLHIEGKGRVNGRQASFVLDGDPLEATRRDAPYAWEFTEESSASRVTVHGSLPHPYDFDLLEGSFEASGENLKDLYFLTGLSLVNTGAYRLTGGIERHGDDSRFTDLQLHTGQSDLEGSLSITALKERAQISALLKSKAFRAADFGARAAGHPPPAEEGPRMFSAATFNPQALRKSDAQVQVSAERVEIGRMSLGALAGRLSIDHGIVTATPITVTILQGKLEAKLRIDANLDRPAVQASLQFRDLELAALEHKGAEAPMEGLMQARVEIDGKGTSVREVAATATGSVDAELPKGAIRASLAELAGIDLRGLGLALAHSKREVAVRCAAAALEARSGTLNVRSLVIDTLPVLITGEGTIHLDTEALGLILRGAPKDVRVLRMEAPVLVQGTLAQPSFSIETHDSKLKLIDAGRGQDVDCTELLAAARMPKRSDR